MACEALKDMMRLRVRTSGAPFDDHRTLASGRLETARRDDVDARRRADMTSDRWSWYSKVVRES